MQGGRWSACCLGTSGLQDRQNTVLCLLATVEGLLHDLCPLEQCLVRVCCCCHSVASMTWHDDHLWWQQLAGRALQVVLQQDM